jgi:hypothetical protein
VPPLLEHQLPFEPLAHPWAPAPARTQKFPKPPVQHCKHRASTAGGLTAFIANPSGIAKAAIRPYFLTLNSITPYVEHGAPPFFVCQYIFFLSIINSAKYRGYIRGGPCSSVAPDWGGTTRMRSASQLSLCERGPVVSSPIRTIARNAREVCTTAGRSVPISPSAVSEANRRKCCWGTAWTPTPVRF